MYIVTAEQMVTAEQNTNNAGISYNDMMENAGYSLAEAIIEQFEAVGQKITILIGPGNNGGDGLVTARYLSHFGTHVQLYIWKRKNLQDDPNWKRLHNINVEIHFHDKDPNYEQLTKILENSSIVVDALLGTGASRPIRGSLARMLTHAQQIITERRTDLYTPLTDPIDPPAVKELGPAVVAVDLPSGLNSNTGEVDPYTIPADMTVTFAAPKMGFIKLPGAAYIGHLLIADINIIPEYFPPNLPVLATASQVSDMLPERPIDGHKGTFGKIMIVSGSINYIGAPCLSALAALRIGAGLVALAVPQTIRHTVATKVTEATYLSIHDQDGAIAPPAVEIIAQDMTERSAMLIGPGIGQNRVTAEFLISLFKSEKDNLPPLVIDADALNILATQPNWWLLLPKNCILTPHHGEMSRLTGMSIAELQTNRLEVTAEMAQKWGQIVLFKGAFTVIANPHGKITVMPFANPALATAGSGDVLAGAIVGLLGQKMKPYQAAIVGAYLHGLAGEIAREQFWDAGVIAGDLLPLLPVAYKEVAESLG